uniref:Uncharacterized protein n=1 Tax=Parascaris univalens TaxID=6257 RepID=A0A915B1M7_PARUN
MCTSTENAQFQLGKPCSLNFHCWRSEPVDASGVPLSITGIFSNQLNQLFVVKEILCDNLQVMNFIHL